MDPLLLVVGAVIVLIVAALIIRSAVRSMRPTVPEQSSSVTTPARTTTTAFVSAPVALSPEATAEIDRLVESDQRIRAIKVYRDHTGVGLREAKEAIDRWAVSTTAVPAPAPHAATPSTPSAVRATLSASVADEIDRLVASDQKIVAIKMLREQTGFGLKQSKDLIEAWPASHHL